MAAPTPPSLDMSPPQRTDLTLLFVPSGHPAGVRARRATLEPSPALSVGRATFVASERTTDLARPTQLALPTRTGRASSLPPICTPAGARRSSFLLERTGSSDSSSSVSSCDPWTSIPTRPAPLTLLADPPSRSIEGLAPSLLPLSIGPPLQLVPPTASLDLDWSASLIPPYLLPTGAASSPDLAQPQATTDTATKRLSAQELVDESQTTPKETKRYHALVELLQTERGYLNSLRILVKVYFQTLPSLALLTTQEIHLVRRNAEVLLALHERIAARLEEAEEETGFYDAVRFVPAQPGARDERVRETCGRVASALLEELSNFKAYEEFCSNHGAALAVISPISQRPEWDLYERQCTNNASDLRRRQYVESTTPTSPFLSPRTSFASLGTSTAGPSTLPTPAVPFDPQATLTRAKSYASTLSSPSSIQNQFAKLRYEDYAIKPVQMICRYQLILGQILKNWEGQGSEEFEDARRQVLLAWDGLRRVAIGVDEAKSRREGELRTKLVASRLDFHSSINSAFCAILGATLLCGSLHVLHHTPSPTGSTEGRLKYYGCFLYRSHLVMVKVKKRDSYLPREWVPLRLLSEIVGIPEGEALLPHSIRLSYSSTSHFDLSASSASEKVIWLATLRDAQRQARKTWSTQEARDGPLLFDDTSISSLLPAASAGRPAARRHGRSRSAGAGVGMSAVLSGGQDPAAVFDYSALSTAALTLSTSGLPSSTKTDPSPTAVSPTVSLSSAPSPSSANRNRFSASSLIGRTPSDQRATIDARLADVFSESLLAARALEARESILAATLVASTSSSANRTSLGSPGKLRSRSSDQIASMSVSKRNSSIGTLARGGLTMTPTGSPVKPPNKPLPSPKKLSLDLPVPREDLHESTEIESGGEMAINGGGVSGSSWLQRSKTLGSTVGAKRLSKIDTSGLGAGGAMGLVRRKSGLALSAAGFGGALSKKSPTVDSPTSSSTLVALASASNSSLRPTLKGTSTTSNSDADVGRNNSVSSNGSSSGTTIDSLKTASSSCSTAPSVSYSTLTGPIGGGKGKVRKVDSPNLSVQGSPTLGSGALPQEESRWSGLIKLGRRKSFVGRSEGTRGFSARVKSSPSLSEYFLGTPSTPIHDALSSGGPARGGGGRSKVVL